MALIRKLFTSLKKMFNWEGAVSRKRRRGKPRRKLKVKASQRPGKKKVIRSAGSEVRGKSPEFKSFKKGKAKTALIGEITHYFSRIQVVVVQLTKEGMNINDQIQIKGKSTDFTQKVKSLQIESVDVKSAKKGQLVGLKVNREARAGDRVFRIFS